MVSILPSGGALALGVLSIALYFAYQAIKPKPLPGIPYNKDAAGKLFGDIPEMMGYVMRTKRIFVRTNQLALASSLGQHSSYLSRLICIDRVVLVNITHYPPSKCYCTGIHQAWWPTMGCGDRPFREPGHSTSKNQGI